MVKYDWKKINNNNYIEKSKKKIVVLGIVLIILVTMLIGGTYALFTINKNGDKQNVIKAGDISMVLDESADTSIAGQVFGKQLKIYATQIVK